MITGDEHYNIHMHQQCRRNRNSSLSTKN